MSRPPVYLDNQSTTRVDPRVVEAMLPFFTEHFGNAASTSHSFGWEAKDAVDAARQRIAAAIGASSREIVFTSGATESNNLAIRGLCERQQRRGNHLVTVQTEHRSVLDPIERLGRRGFEVTYLGVEQAGSDRAGRLDADQLRGALRDDTLLVSVMLANNEIGVIQPLPEIAEVCRERGAFVHCDATQAVGKIRVNVKELGIDLMSFTAHKIHGPKGVGALWVRGGSPRVRLEQQILGGGHEMGLRSGTLNVPLIVGFAKALELAVEEMPVEQPRLARLRNRLFKGLQEELEGVSLNGPALGDAPLTMPSATGADGSVASLTSFRPSTIGLQPPLRLAGNLNLSFAFVDGEALLINMRDVAVSSGSACTSANPEPSHVLRALGLSEDATRSSLRFGLGRFNTPEDIEFAIGTVAQVVRRLRKLSSLA